VLPPYFKYSFPHTGIEPLTPQNFNFITPLFIVEYFLF
jgi:hypothetical protein